MFHCKILTVCLYSGWVTSYSFIFSTSVLDVSLFCELSLLLVLVLFLFSLCSQYFFSSFSIMSCASVFIQKIYSMIICICRLFFTNESPHIIKEIQLTQSYSSEYFSCLWFVQSLLQWLDGVQEPSPISFFVLQVSFCSQHLYFLCFGAGLYFDDSQPSFSPSNTCHIHYLSII